MPRDLVIWPSPVLTTPTRPVTDFGPGLGALLMEMNQLVHAAKGIGIAANQMGLDLRVALVGREDGTFFEIVNPKILETSEPVDLEEGCLSIPDYFEKTPRFHRVKVRYFDRDLKEHEVAAEGRLAHIFQHEIDHLDGRVFVDHLSALKRGLIRERMKKLKRSKA